MRFPRWRNQILHSRIRTHPLSAIFDREVRDPFAHQTPTLYNTAPPLTTNHPNASRPYFNDNDHDHHTLLLKNNPHLLRFPFPFLHLPPSSSSEPRNLPQFPNPRIPAATLPIATTPPQKQATPPDRRARHASKPPRADRAAHATEPVEQRGGDALRLCRAGPPGNGGAGGDVEGGC